MAIVVPDEGKRALNWIVAVSVVNTSEQNQGVVRLFKNNVTPGAATVLADFTESTFPGYAAVNLANPVDNGINGFDQDVVTWDNASFALTSGGPENVYGYYVEWQYRTGPLAGTFVVLWCELLPTSPTSMAVVGQTILFTPTFNLAEL